MIAMRVACVRRETEEIVSFLFKAADGRALPRYLPGQHIRVAIMDGEHTVARSYTLSSSPLDDAYAISVKREATGRMSTLLHDHVRPGTIVQGDLGSRITFEPEFTIGWRINHRYRLEAS